MTGVWEAVTEQEERWFASVVIIATGHYNDPVVPRWHGLDGYTGRVVHSRDYGVGTRVRR